MFSRRFHIEMIPARPLNKKDRIIVWVIVAGGAGVMGFVVYMIMR